MYCGLRTGSNVLFIFGTQLYQYFTVFFLFALFSDKPEVFLPEYSVAVILYADHIRRVIMNLVPMDVA